MLTDIHSGSNWYCTRRLSLADAKFSRELMKRSNYLIDMIFSFSGKKKSLPFIQLHILYSQFPYITIHLTIISMTLVESVQVAIIGAGLSGLRAATEIHDAGLSYVVLEAMDRVGGKTLSVPTSSTGDAVVDLGAAWINDTTQAEMYAMAQEFGFNLVVQRAEGRSIHQDAHGGFNLLPFGVPADVSDALTRQSTIANPLVVDDRRGANSVQELPSQTFRIC